MATDERVEQLQKTYLVADNHAASDYFGYIRELIKIKQDDPGVQSRIDQAYQLVEDEIIENQQQPVNEITFGTSGWRGILGKDVFLKSVSCVTRSSLSVLPADRSAAMP